MAGKTAILSVRIVSDSKSGVAGLLNTAKAVKTLERAARDSRDSMRDLVGSTPKIAAAAAGITTLAAAGLAGTSNVLALAGAVTAVGGAALVLPGVLAGGAIAVGVLKAALVDAETVLASTITEFQGLQDVISSSFWERAAAPIRDLATSAMPMLRQQAGGVATELGKVVAGIAETIGSTRGLAQIGGLFHQTREAIKASGEGTRAMTAALLTLASVGATYLPRLGQWFTDIATRFKTFVDTAAADGSLREWIDNGIVAMQDLGRITGAVFGIFGSLSRAAAEAGGVGLGAFADGLERVNVAMAGPAFQGALVTVFEGAHQAMTNLAPGIVAVGDAFIALAPTLAYIMALGGSAASALLEGFSAVLAHPAFQGGLRAAFDGIVVGIGSLAPAFEAVAPALGALLQTFGVLAMNVLPIVSSLIVALAPLITAVAEALRPLIAALGESLLNAVNLIVPPLVDFAQRVLPGITAAVTPLAPVIVGFAAVWALQWVAMAAVATANALRMAAAWLIAMGPVGWVIATVIAVALVIYANWDKISAWSRNMAQVVSSSIIAGFRRVVSGVAAGVAAVASSVSAGWSRVVSFTSTAWATARALVSSAWSAIRSAVITGAFTVVSHVASLPGRIVGALAGMAMRMYSIGSQMMAGLKSGIMAWAGNIIGSVAGIVGNAIAGAKNLLGIRSPSRVFRKIGEQTGQGLVIGLEAMSSKVRDATRDLISVPSALPMSADLNLNYQGRGTTQQVVVQNTIRVEGTVIDRLGTAEAIKGVLREHDLLLGQAV